MDNPGFYLFGYKIYYYGLIITIGIAVALVVGFILAKKKGYYKDIVFDMALAILPLGIIGARLYFIIFNGSPLSDFFNFRDGGIAIYGAVIGGALGLLILAKLKKQNYFKFTDIVVIALILAQAIGRWANFINQEVYGVEITNPNWQFFPFAVKIDALGSWHLATFFIEFVFNLIGFFILLKIFNKSQKHGTVSGTYLIYYGIVRALLELVRVDNLMIGSMQISFVISLICIAGGVIILLFNKKSNRNQIQIEKGADKNGG